MAKFSNPVGVFNLTGSFKDYLKNLVEYKDYNKYMVRFYRGKKQPIKIVLGEEEYIVRYIIPS